MLGAACCSDGSCAAVPDLLAKLQIALSRRISKHRHASQPSVALMCGVDAHCDLLCAGTERQMLSSLQPGWLMRGAYPFGDQGV